MYLIDTNIWLERLLHQQKSEEVGAFLDTMPAKQLRITDFSLHSIAIILDDLDKIAALSVFVRDVCINGGVAVIHLEPDDTDTIIAAMRDYRLDFDDAYQYVAAVKYDLTIVSFDADFNRTEKGRKTPADILVGLAGQ